MSSKNTQPQAAEDWRACVGFPGYEVSNFGNVRSLDRTVTTANGSERTCKGQPLKPRRTPEGYLVASLSIGGIKWHKLVHVLVAHAFLGEPPDGAEVHHINRKRGDNRAANLEYKEGSAHLSEHFTGENNPAAKLSDAKIATLQRLIHEGKSQRQIALILQVNQSTICRAATGTTWKHVHKPTRRPTAHPAQMDLFLDFDLADVAEMEF